MNNIQAHNFLAVIALGANFICWFGAGYIIRDLFVEALFLMGISVLLSLITDYSLSAIAKEKSRLLKKKIKRENKLKLYY